MFPLPVFSKTYANFKKFTKLKCELAVFPLNYITQINSCFSRHRNIKIKCKKWSRLSSIYSSQGINNDYIVKSVCVSPRPNAWAIKTNGLRWHHVVEWTVTVHIFFCLSAFHLQRKTCHSLSCRASGCEIFWGFLSKFESFNHTFFNLRGHIAQNAAADTVFSCLWLSTPPRLASKTACEQQKLVGSSIWVGARRSVKETGTFTTCLGW